MEKMHLKGKYSWLKHIDFIVLDIFAVVVSFLIACFIKFGDFLFINRIAYRIVLVSIIFIDFILAVITNQYSNVLRRGKSQEIIKTIIFAIYNYLFLSAILYLLKIGQDVSREATIVLYVIYMPISIIFKTFCKFYILKKINKVLKEGI